MSDGVPTHLRVAICQINTIVGDLDGNVALALEALAEAEEARQAQLAENAALAAQVPSESELVLSESEEQSSAA